MNHIDLSLKLELTFAKYTTEVRFTRNLFEHKPTETIEEALCWLHAKGIIKDELSMLLEEYNFGSGNLKEILQNESYEEKILEIIAKY